VVVHVVVLVAVVLEVRSKNKEVPIESKYSAFNHANIGHTDCLFAGESKFYVQDSTLSWLQRVPNLVLLAFEIRLFAHASGG